jgi:acyl-CoA reductase-like NAD-dependent aldehyde dehydrogenase
VTGDPTVREHWMGPLIDAHAVARYEDAAAQVHALGAAGALVHGGERLDHGDLAHGHVVAPTVARAPIDHPLWSQELFAPFVLVAPVDSVDEGVARANASDYGLTAGFYGDPGETGASSRPSRRASRTRTVRRERRRVRGRATSRSAAGRARDRPARPRARSTT